MRELNGHWLVIVTISVCASLCPCILGDHAFAEGDVDVTVLHYEVDSSLLLDGEKVHKSQMASLITTLGERLGQMGRVKVSGNGEIEIRVKGGIDQVELESIKRRISTLGYLEFHFTADSERPEDQLIIEQAQLLRPNKKKVLVDSVVAAEWVALWGEDFNPAVAKDHHVVQRVANAGPEILVLKDSLNLSGEYLTAAKAGIDKDGENVIDFLFDRDGLDLLREETTKFTRLKGRFLGLLLDNRFAGGKALGKKLDNSILTGLMSEHDVNSIIAITSAGMLPYPLRESR